MDNITWFKFSPSNWFMGKIQRCPEITQARFIRLCSLYWNKGCVLSIEDAEIEIDKEHLDILTSKKVISLNSDYINISFLDEQNVSIEDKSTKYSESGKIGNLKRWHNDIYKEYLSKRISLDEAIKQAQSIAHPSPPDSHPISTQSQNIADKIREDKRREEEKRKDNSKSKFDFYKSILSKGVNDIVAKDYLAVRKAKRASNTETAFNLISKKIETSNYTWQQAIEICCERSWVGFNQDWITGSKTVEVNKPLKGVIER